MMRSRPLILSGMSVASVVYTSMRGSELYREGTLVLKYLVELV